MSWDLRSLFMGSTITILLVMVGLSYSQIGELKERSLYLEDENDFLRNLTESFEQNNTALVGRASYLEWNLTRLSIELSDCHISVDNARNGQKVVFMNNFSTRWFNLRLIEDCHMYSPEYGREIKCLAWTDGVGNVYMLNGMTKEEVKNACVHEMLHNIIRYDREELLVELLTPYSMVPDCEELSSMI